MACSQGLRWREFRDSPPHSIDLAENESHAYQAIPYWPGQVPRRRRGHWQSAQRPGFVSVFDRLQTAV
jgi:hypothetical protein